MRTAHSPSTDRDTAGAAGGRDPVAELCTLVLASLPRSDQRRRGELYVRGLLGAEGRKSMRNLAALTGGPAVEQSLHHFISKSTWDWEPVRRALARRLTEDLAPRAWVVEPITIPKAGRSSVGVESRFVSRLGRVATAQQAYGLWLTSPEAGVPVNWRLLLSDRWVEDEERRRRAEIPDRAADPSADACARAVALDTAGWGLPALPVLMDVRESGAAGAVSAFTVAGIPFLLRVDPAAPVLAGNRTHASAVAGPLPARQLAGSVHRMSRPVEWIDPRGPALRTSLVVAPRVTLPGRAGGGRLLRLLAEFPAHRCRDPRLWLTDLVDLPASTLLRLAKLGARTAKDLAEVCEPAGIRDFEGRSFTGWHRHTTLVSVAHAASALAAADRSADCYRRGVPA
jgi:hypothetical protein